MLIGLHASSEDNITDILQNGFRPGEGHHHWLGSGIYLYGTGDAPSQGINVAIANATAFARKKFPGKNIACAVVALDPAHCLDLQHFTIFSALEKFHAVLISKMKSVGLRLERDSNWVRANSHFSIDAFVSVVSLLSGNPIHTIRTQFNGTSAAPIEERKNPELCVKHPSAILDAYRASSTQDIFETLENHRDWIPSNGLIKAAEEASEFVRHLEDVNAVDLACKIAEGANNLWYGKARFPTGRRASTLLIREPTPLSSIAQEVFAESPLLKPSSIIQAKDWKNISGPEEARRVANMVDNSDALIVVADAPSSGISTVLIRAREKQKQILILATKSADIPCDVRSMMNVNIFNVGSKTSKKELSTILSGFSRDSWKSETQEVSMRFMLAARDCDRETKFSRAEHVLNIKRILEEDRKNPTELPGLAQSDADCVLANMPNAPEAVADELRSRLKIETQAISRNDMLKALAPAKFMTVKMTASGYLVDTGLLRSYRIVALKEGNSPERQRFTAAHEIGHAIVSLAKAPLRIDEEDWCDEFASALLMPKAKVTEFAANVTSLMDWFEFEKTFQVSHQAAMKRLWQCERILLVRRSSLNQSPRPEDARELMSLSEKVGYIDKRGALPNGAQYLIRRTRTGAEAVANFKAVRPASLAGV